MFEHESVRSGKRNKHSAAADIMGTVEGGARITSADPYSRHVQSHHTVQRDTQYHANTRKFNNITKLFLFDM